MPLPSACTTLENVDVECTHCGVLMSSHVGGGGTIRYFHCPSCARWTTSMYAEVLRADSKMRTRRPSAPRAPSGTVRQRIEAWLQSLSESDPFQVLGVPPTSSDTVVRERYLALARQHHPDRGGSAEQMQRINEAYEQVLLQRERQRAGTRRTASLPPGH